MNSIEKVWKKLLNDVLRDGEKHEKDDGDKLYEKLINHEFIPNVLNMLFCGGESITSQMFLEMIGNGVFNIDGYPLKDEALMEYVMQLDDETQIFIDDYEDSFIYTYPERIFAMKTVNRENGVGLHNQFEVMCERLKNFEGSNRAVATLYNVGLDRAEQHIPCLNWLQTTIRDDELVLHIMFRSNDLYSAFPSNMMFLMYLGLKFVDELKEDYPLLKFKGINYNSTSLHIYKGDLEQAKEVIGYGD